MRILYVSPYYPEGVGARDVLTRFPLLSYLPAEMRRRGHQVRLIGQADTSLRGEHSGVGYEFHRPSFVIRAGAALMNRWKPRYGRAYYEPAWSLASRISKLRPQVVHIFGMTMDLHLPLLTRSAHRVGAIVVFHYHGGLPANSRTLRAIQRRNLRAADLLLVTASEQVDPWRRAGLVPDSLRVEVLVESSSPFQGLDRQHARQITGMAGDPVCLSVGRLHPIKDPVTTLRGFERIARERPAARLYLYYLTDELHAELQTFVNERPVLSGKVEFRGRASPEQMEAIYSSADFLLQASLREWSGLAVLEAMSCGCIPVVSDIPSFRQITSDGRFGMLFPRGDDRSLAEQVLKISQSECRMLQENVREHFAQELSFTAMAERLEQFYRSVLERS